MDNLDIPDANVQSPQNYNNSTNINQDLVQLVTNKVKTISQSKPSVEFTIQEIFPYDLIEQLKSKGYVLTIYQFYDSSDDSYNSKVKVKNPNFSNPSSELFDNIEKQCREFGFSSGTSNLNENASKLFEMFKNSC